MNFFIGEKLESMVVHPTAFNVSYTLQPLSPISVQYYFMGFQMMAIFCVWETFDYEVSHTERK